MLDTLQPRTKFEEALTFFHEQTHTLRTGRAVPAIVENIMVSAYNAKSPLIQLASINTPDPRTILIQPWDKSVLKDIEKAIAAANINLTPIVDGSNIRLSIPPLTEENRKAIVRRLHEMAESSRVVIRQTREKIRADITKAEREEKIGEDEKFRDFKALDEIVKEYTSRVEEETTKKEKEIMTL
ncbi:MAG: ribosome recycling factor [Patescibacteria group bacterium]